MFIRKVRSEGLAAISYMIGSGGEAVVVDPRRDVDEYIRLAKEEEVRITHVLETHRHEDFVVGSSNLSKLTGARILHGPGLRFGYGETAGDGVEFESGSLRFTAMHTPGHTDESTSYAVEDLDSGNGPFMVFTGDTLFVGEVGRTDMYGPEEAPRLATALFNSLHRKLLPLGDGVIIAPAHGAGSVCGKAISERERSTIGLERRDNPRLQMDEEEFVAFKLAEEHPFPPYFKRMEEMNLNGSDLMLEVPSPSPLSPRRFKGLMPGAMVIDTRSPACFAGAYIGGAYNIQLDGLSSFTGAVLDWDVPLLLMLERGDDLEDAVRRLARIGYDRVEGYLRGGMVDWYEASMPTEHMGLLTVQELAERLDEMLVIDVRGKEEYDAGHVAGAMHVPCPRMEEEDVPRGRPIAVTCSIGYRGTLGASILRKRGYEEVYNVLGGMNAWRNADMPLAMSPEE